MTLEQVAMLCNTTRQTIQRYESGVIVNIPLKRLGMLANALGVSPVTLSDFTGSDDEEQLLEIFRSLNANDKKKLIEIAGVMKK